MADGEKTPWWMHGRPAYACNVKHKDFLHDQNQKPAGESRATVADSSPAETDFAPSPDEVARKAFFSYVNQGSMPGNAVQHWLAAEAQLIEERKLTRTHGFHNRT